MGLLDLINDPPANSGADSGGGWVAFGKRPEGGAGAWQSPFTIQVNGTTQLFSLGDQIGSTDNPDVTDWLNCDCDYAMLYGCEFPFTPSGLFDFPLCPNGITCDDSEFYIFSPDDECCCEEVCTITKVTDAIEVANSVFTRLDVSQSGSSWVYRIFGTVGQLADIQTAVNNCISSSANILVLDFEDVTFSGNPELENALLMVSGITNVINNGINLQFQYDDSQTYTPECCDAADLLTEINNDVEGASFATTNTATHLTPFAAQLWDGLTIRCYTLTEECCD